MAGEGGGEVGVPQNIMRALCVVIRPNHFIFASYGPVEFHSGLRSAQNIL